MLCVSGASTSALLGMLVLSWLVGVASRALLSREAR